MSPPPLRARLSIRRPITSYEKVQLALSPLLRGRKFQTRRIGLRRYLNVGCGLNFPFGFVNLDYHWSPGVDLCWNMLDRLPFRSGELEGIFCEHALEHVSLEEGLVALQEFRRVLRPDGIARVVVPDVGLYLDAYFQHRLGVEVAIPNVPCPLPEGMTPLVAISRTFFEYGHLCAYDEETLRGQMHRAGFSTVERQSFGVGLDSVLLIDTPARAHESLYMEARA